MRLALSKVHPMSNVFSCILIFQDDEDLPRAALPRDFGITVHGATLRTALFPHTPRVSPTRPVWGMITHVTVTGRRRRYARLILTFQPTWRVRIDSGERADHGSDVASKIRGVLARPNFRPERGH